MVAYLPWLGLTVAIELALALLICRRSHRGRELLRLIAAVVLLNGFTHPFAFLIAEQSALGSGWRFWGLESAVFAVEAVGYRTVMAMAWGRAVGVSLVCNGVTAGLSHFV